MVQFLSHPVVMLSTHSHTLSTHIGLLYRVIEIVVKWFCVPFPVISCLHTCYESLTLEALLFCTSETQVFLATSRRTNAFYSVNGLYVFSTVNFIFNYYFPLLTAFSLRFTFHSYYYINFISPWRKQSKHT